MLKVCLARFCRAELKCVLGLSLSAFHAKLVDSHPGGHLSRLLKAGVSSTVVYSTSFLRQHGTEGVDVIVVKRDAAHARLMHSRQLLGMAKYE
jgi:hypothetical protein